MRRRIGVSAALLAAVATLVPPAMIGTAWAAPGRSPVVLHDNFNDGVANGWASYNRNWSVVDGRFTVNGGYVDDPCGRGGWALTHAGDTTWTDYVVSARVFLQPSPWYEGELLFRVGSQTSDCLPYGYRLEIWSEYYAAESRLHLVRYDSRGGVPLAEVRGTAQTNIPPLATEVSVRIEVRGTRITVWIGDKQVLAYTDSQNPPLLSGGVGLLGIWESTPAFDNVKVRLLK